MLESVYLEGTLGMYLAKPQAFVNEANTATLVYTQDYYKQHGVMDVKEFDAKVDSIVRYILAQKLPALGKMMRTRIVRKRRGRLEFDLYIGLDPMYQGIFDNNIPGIKLHH